MLDIEHALEAIVIDAMEWEEEMEEMDESDDSDDEMNLDNEMVDEEAYEVSM